MKFGVSNMEVGLVAVGLCLLPLRWAAAVETPVAGAGLPAASGEVKAVANSTNRFEIRGMSCEACAKGITAELRALPGVTDVTVSFPTKRAMVAYDTNRVTQGEVVRVIREAGYRAIPLKGRKGNRP